MDGVVATVQLATAGCISIEVGVPGDDKGAELGRRCEA
jgi:hypothetical protein